MCSEFNYLVRLTKRAIFPTSFEMCGGSVIKLGALIATVLISFISTALLILWDIRLVFLIYVSPRFYYSGVKWLHSSPIVQISPSSSIAKAN